MLHQNSLSEELVDLDAMTNDAYALALGKDAIGQGAGIGAAHRLRPARRWGESVRRSQKQQAPAAVTRSLPVNSDDGADEHSIETLPYQAQLFKSSTVVKTVPMIRRHQDISPDSPVAQNTQRKKVIILHAERYRWDELKSDLDNSHRRSLPTIYVRALGCHATATLDQPQYQSLTRGDRELRKVAASSDAPAATSDRMTQRERLLAEHEYIAKLRSRKQMSEHLPHREPRELLMGGSKAPFGERFDIKEELRRLRGIVLPLNARELYHGRGITLPPGHASLRPRARPTLAPPTGGGTNAFGQSTSALVAAKVPTVLVAPTWKQQPQKTPAKQPKAKKAGTLLHFPKLDKSQPPDAFARSYTVPTGTPYGRKMNTALPTLPDVMAVASTSLPRTASGVDEDDALTESPKDRNRSLSPEEGAEQQRAPTAAKPAKPPPTPNPLRGADTRHFDVDAEKLRSQFARLDTDADGHLTYPQAISNASGELNSWQEKFIKLIYEITSSSTFFGLQEFVHLQCLYEEMSRLSGEVIESYASADFVTLKDDVMQYVELFEKADKASTGRISTTALEDLLSAMHSSTKDPDFIYAFEHVCSALNLDPDRPEIDKMKFVASIPYFVQMKRLYPEPDDT